MFRGVQLAPIDVGKPSVKEECGLYSRRVEENRKGGCPSRHRTWGSGRTSGGVATLSCTKEGERMVV